MAVRGGAVGVCGAASGARRAWPGEWTASQPATVVVSRSMFFAQGGPKKRIRWLHSQ